MNYRWSMGGQALDFQIRWGFMNSYMLAKNLTERLVASHENRLAGLVIVRPTAVGALAEAPCPGFIGNSSGFTGAMIAGAYGTIPPPLPISSPLHMCVRSGRACDHFQGSLRVLGG